VLTSKSRDIQLGIIIIRSAYKITMADSENIFIAEERRVWMRLRDHIAIFERDPDFDRFVTDPSGSVLHVIRIWVGCPKPEAPKIRHYLGSIRRCECGGWMSHRELLRLFRRARFAARLLGERAEVFRDRLSGFLREHFDA
jgi:hypothetical protein